MTVLRARILASSSLACITACVTLCGCSEGHDPGGDSPIEITVEDYRTLEAEREAARKAREQGAAGSTSVFAGGDRGEDGAVSGGSGDGDTSTGGSAGGDGDVLSDGAQDATQDGAQADGDAPDENGRTSGDRAARSCDPGQCEGFSGFAGDLAGCCTADGLCGVDFGALTGEPQCLRRDAPGEPSDECPSIDAGGFPIPGCCTAGGTCGVIIQMTAPLGCVDTTLLGAGLPIPGLSGSAGSDPIPCTP
ncbi:MAG: hypothetical protein PVI30_24160 [Myxococcales bacterium]|jgi:hypothetical protein